MANVRFAALLTVTLAALSSAPARAEVFKLEATGVESCGDFHKSKFGARNNIDTWVSVVSPDEWWVSLTPFFLEDSTFPVVGRTHVISSKQAIFTGAQFFDFGFIAVEATLSLDRTGVITKVKGTFIQDSVFVLGCMSKGKVKTTERLAP